MTERAVIRLSQFINHPPEKVWKALTDPEIHAKWWAAGDVKAVVGHRFTLDMGPWVNNHVRFLWSSQSVF